jgi:hypothetical protein
LEFALVVIININYVFIMAKQKTDIKLVVKNVSRPGVHAKTKTSKIKTSKLYKKKYRGQGK